MNIGPYPSGWKRTARTRDDTEFRIRPIRPDDTDRECRFIEALSPESRHKRLMYAVHDPSSSLIQHMVNVDFTRTMAFVAVAANCGADKSSVFRAMPQTTRRNLTTNSQ